MLSGCDHCLWTHYGSLAWALPDHEVRGNVFQTRHWRALSKQVWDIGRHLCCLIQMFGLSVSLTPVFSELGLNQVTFLYPCFLIHSAKEKSQEASLSQMFAVILCLFYVKFSTCCQWIPLRYLCYNTISHLYHAFTHYKMCSCSWWSWTLVTTLWVSGCEQMWTWEAKSPPARDNRSGEHQSRPHGNPNLSPYGKKKCRHRDTRVCAPKRDHVRTQQKGSHPPAQKGLQGNPSEATPWCGHFIVQDFEKINCCCLSHLVCGILFWEP